MPARGGRIVLLSAALLVMACSSAERPFSELPSEPSSFSSLEEAIAFVRTKVDVPVAAPRPLPHGTHLVTRRAVIVTTEPQSRAQITLETHRGREIVLMYGVSGFDGCGAEPRPIDIAGHPGLLNSHDDMTTVIWPVEDGGLSGRYGIFGQLPRRKIVALAESMAAPEVESLPPSSTGC